MTADLAVALVLLIAHLALFVYASTRIYQRIKDRRVVGATLRALLELGTAEPSRSPYALPILVLIALETQLMAAVIVLSYSGGESAGPIAILGGIEVALAIGWILRLPRVTVPNNGLGSNSPSV